LGMATALTAFTAMAWSDAVMLASIDVDKSTSSSGTATFLTPAKDPGGKPGCGTSPFLELSGSTEHVKTMMSMAMTALLAGRSLKFSYETNCDGNYALVNSMLIQ